MQTLLFRKLNELTCHGQLIEHNMVIVRIEPELPATIHPEYLREFETMVAEIQPFAAEIHSTLYFSRPWTIIRSEGKDRFRES